MLGLLKQIKKHLVDSDFIYHRLIGCTCTAIASIKCSLLKYEQCEYCREQVSITLFMIVYCLCNLKVVMAACISLACALGL